MITNSGLLAAHLCCGLHMTKQKQILTCRCALKSLIRLAFLRDTKHLEHTVKLLFPPFIIRHQDNSTEDQMLSVLWSSEPDHIQRRSDWFPIDVVSARAPSPPHAPCLQTPPPPPTTTITTTTPGSQRSMLSTKQTRVHTHRNTRSHRQTLSALVA